MQRVRCSQIAAVVAMLRSAPLHPAKIASEEPA